MEGVIPLVTDGQYRGLPCYERQLMRLPTGTRTTLAARLLVRNDDLDHGHLCQGLILGQIFRLKAPLPSDTVTVTVINAPVTFFRLPTLEPDASSHVLSFPVRNAKELLEMVETCAGIGGIAKGAEHAGFVPKAQNEVQAKFCMYQQKHAKSTVIEGDIGKLNTIAQMHQAAPHAGTMSFGFSCQPWSQLGDRQEGQDERAMTLPYGLYAAYLLQVEIVVLECVPQAAQSTFVQNCLKYHLQMSHSTRTETLLELSNCWPAKRRRWWTVITKSYYGHVTLQPLPELVRKPTIQGLLPSFLQLTEHEKNQLTLNSQERVAYHNYGNGIHSQLVDTNAPMNTALHSWGNAVTDCACLCRPAFSHRRLEQHGLFGALVFEKHEKPDKNLRHLGPREVCLLQGMPIHEGWDEEQRLLLAGLGQIASPIQSCWIFGQIAHHLSNAQYITGEVRSPKQCLVNLFRELFTLRDEWFDHNHTVPMQLFMEDLGQAFNANFMLTPSQEDTAFHEAVSVQVSVHDSTATSPHESHEVSAIPVEDVTHDTMGVHEEAPTPMDEDSNDASADSPAMPAMVEETTVEVTDGPEEVPMEVDHNEGTHDNPITATGVPVPAVDTGAGPMTCEEPSPSCATPGTVLSLDPRTQASPSEPVDSEVSVVPSEHTPMQRVINPDHLLTDQLVVLDLQTNTYCTLNPGVGTTVAQLKQADQDLTHEQVTWYNILGDEVDLTEPVGQHQFLMKGTFPVECTGTDLRARAAMLQQMPTEITLALQGHAVATDEMDYYLQSIVAIENTVGFPAIICDDLSDAAIQIEESIEAYYHEVKHNEVGFTAVLWGTHWWPLIIQQDKLVTTPEGMTFLQSCDFQQLPVDFIDEVESQFSQDCGFQTLAWIIQHIQNGVGSPVSYARAMQFRFCAWIRQYGGHLRKNPQYLRLGGAQDLEIALGTLLKEHGVFATRIPERTKTVLSKLGPQLVLKSIQSTRPWAMLKQASNQQSPPLRLVLEDEFQQLVQARTGDKQPVKNKKKNSKGDRPSAVPISPEDIFIPTGVFSDDQGSSVPHLPIRELKAGATGVILTTELEFQAYQNQTKISDGALGFLVMTPFSEHLQQMGIQIRFPAQVQKTGEPVLLTAILIQKGGKDIRRSKPAVQHEVQQVETQTVKILAYRDQISQWEEFIQKPIRYILDHLPMLQSCKQESCSCPAWHGDTQNGHEPLLDVWARDYVTQNFARTKAPDAAIFTCLMRVIKPVFSSMSQASGTAGLYVEPRSCDGRQHDSQHHTVWMPKCSMEQAIATKSIAPVECYLIRVNNRYGLRTGQHEALKLHEHVKPGIPFIGGNRVMFRMGPMPFGTTKMAIQKLFTQWSWSAQVIQTQGRSQCGTGLMWQIASHTTPPHTVYVMAHGDVMITRDSQPPTQAAPVPQIEASKLTRQVLGAAPPLEGDPWMPAAKQLPSYQARQTTNTSLSSAQVQQIEQSIEQKLMAKLQPAEDDPMEGSLAPKVAALEAQLTQLSAAHDETRQRTQQMQTSIEGIHRQIEHQGSQQQAALEKQINTQLKSQLKEIEALFNKRLKTGAE
eukprot:Skav229362  [mRNA]  locus=scaffold3209:156150:160939:- [translate_table: standard]